MKNTIFIASAVLAAFAFLSGCQTVPTEISEDLDARQLIQLGQDSFDNHHYKASEKYFNTVIDRYGDDPKHYLEAKYELGHLYLKQKKYSAAYDNFMEIEEIYKSVPVGLPGAYKILCGIELAKIPPEKIKEFEERRNAPVQEPEPEPEPEQKPSAGANENSAQKPSSQNGQAETKENEPSNEEGPNESSESANE